MSEFGGELADALTLALAGLVVFDYNACYTIRLISNYVTELKLKIRLGIDVRFNVTVFVVLGFLRLA
jgi:hypothetical protein